MSQDLAEKIRAAAQAKNIDPEVALAIARAESSLRPSAQAGTSSAGGLFQVVDKTWKEFGGNPKKKLDADENIRVGTDIIAKNTQTLKAFLNRDPRPAEVYAAHYFGPTGAKTFLAADPATPIVDILGQKAVAANPNLKGKTAGQVLAQLEKKMGSAPAAPAPTRQANVSRETPPQKFLEPNPLEPLAPAAQAPLAPANKLASLGPGYQAALALSFLADTDDKEDRDIDREPGIAEKWLAESATASRPASLAEFSDISIKSPFAALEPKQPQMLADGGEVEEESAPDVGRPTVSETQLAKVMFPDLPVAEAVYLIRGGQRQSTPMGEMLSGNIGAMVPMGKDASAMLMLAGSRPERSMSESKALMAAFNKRVGDEGGLDINVVRPLDAPPGIFAGGMSASYPLGEGRISGNINALKLPGQDPRITGYGVGYGGRVGPGNLSAGIMKQKDGPYSGQIEYRLPIGRADGGEVGHLTPQQIERLAEKNIKLTGINNIIDFVAQRVDPQTKGLPTSARTLLETVQGGRSRITEANFSPEEIDVMRQLATLKGGDKGSINYADYVALAGEMNKQGKMPASMSPGLLSMADPMGNVQTTLGQFRYQRDPKGNLQISDTYDFNPPNPNAMQEARTGDYGAFGVYGLIRDYAGERIPPGMGRDVRVNMPPVKRSGGGDAAPTPEELEAASRPATVNPNIQRQGEAARRLAAMRDVNTLPDPRTYAAVSGFLGQAPDELGFSVMHPDREGIKKAGQAGFGVGTALQVAPVAAAVRGIAGKGTTTAAKMMEGMRDVPVGMSIKPVQSIFSPIPSADAPFVGRLDEFVSGLPGPVQKDQFLGMLKGKMRDYDIARAETTLADLPGNAKLNPVDLLNRIKTQYDPSQFKTTITPPKSDSFYQKMDNPYYTDTGSSPPLGVIHLSQTADPALAQVQQVADSARTALSKLDSRYYGHEWSPQVADDLIRAADNPALALSEGTANGMRSLATQYRQLAAQENVLERARSDMIYPAANPEFRKKAEAYRKELESQGVNFRDAYRLSDIRATQEAIESGNNALRANNLPTMEVPDLSKIDNPPMWALENTPESEGFKKKALALFDIARAPLKEARDNLIAPANELSAAFRKDVGHLIPYQGQHTTLNNPANPISFSRFSEHTTEIPGIGKADGIYVNELQSDRLDDLRKLGPKGGSAEKDIAEVQRLQAQHDDAQRAMYSAQSSGDEALASQYDTQSRALRKRISTLSTRKREGEYSLPESFAGMENSPQVVQQLMVKNAITGAMQMGKQFVAFPGKESAQAQLYEKLGPNLKSVVKDLGPGFEIRDVTLLDPDGKQLMHKAIVWGPDAAARVQKKGVPFKDGGAVERQTADHRKYL